MQIDFLHLGALFVLDSNKDGIFSLKEIYEFAQMCAGRRRLHGAYEFQSQIQGYCTIELAKAVETTEGVEEFVDWFSTMILKNAPTIEFSDFPGFLCRVVEFTMKQFA